MTGQTAIEWRLMPLSELAAAADSWDQLNAQCGNSPLLDAAFAGLLLKYFGDGREKLALARAGDKLVAAAVVSKDHRLSWQSFQASQAPLGLWLQRQNVETRHLMSGLQSALGAGCLALGVSQQDPDLLHRPASENGIRTLDYIRTARVSLKGSFEDYWSQRGKNLRQNLRRQRNRLRREKVVTRMEAIREADRVGRAVDDYGMLESAGWKSERGTAVHPDNAQGQFYRELMETYCGRNESVVFRYYYDETLVACDLCLERDGTVYLLKTAHCEKQKTSSPAMLMLEEMLQTLFEAEGGHSVEFYGRVMNWHTKWTDDIRTMYHVTRFRPSFLARLRRPSQQHRLDDQ